MPFADATGEDLTQCGAVNFLSAIRPITRSQLGPASPLA